MDFEFGQAVMAAAGVFPILGWHKASVTGNCWHCGRILATGKPIPYEHCPGAISYPDPLTSEGFSSIWDALVAKKRIQNMVEYYNHFTLQYAERKLTCAELAYDLRNFNHGGTGSKNRRA